MGNCCGPMGTTATTGRGQGHHPDDEAALERRSPTSTFRTAAHEEAASSRTSVGAEADVEPWDVGGEASSSLQTGIVPAQDQEDYLWTRPRTDDQCGWSRLGRDNIHCRASLGTTVRVPRDEGMC